MQRFLRYFSIFFILTLSLFAAAAPSKAKVLTPEEAFRVDVLPKYSDAIVLKVTLGQDIYLYDDKIKLELFTPKPIVLDAHKILPAPQKYEEYLVHNQSFEIKIPREILQESLKQGPFTLKFSYQGCSKLGICYEPMSYESRFNLDPSGSISLVLPEQDKIAYALGQGNIFVTLATFFGFGLLLALTPCVFPMIPILSSIIISQPNKTMNSKRGFFLSLVYVLSMALAYTIAGILAGLFGENLQASMQNPWVISFFSALFVLLALSMFGFYEIKIPHRLQTKLTKTSHGALTSKGRLVGVAIMGFLSALIVGPCVAAPLAGALIYIGQSGNALLGGSALFVMSLGMGVPLLIIGTTAGKLMPRPGKWMQHINTFFGIMLLGVAIWMLSRILDGQITMALWTFLCISGAIYAGAIEPLKPEAAGWMKLFKSIAFMLLIYGIVLGIGLLSGSTNPLNPLEKFSQSNHNATNSSSSFISVNSLEYLNKEIQEANKIVMLDFYADWCVNCVEFEKLTFSDERVKEKLQKIKLLKADVTHNTRADKAMQKAFNVYGPPAILFFKDGKEMSEFRLIGFQNADAFLAHLGQLGI